MLEQIKKIITDHKCDVEGITKYLSSGCLKVGIEQGSCEGYYVTICDGCGVEYALRMHSYDQAMKTLGCMLKLIPTNH